MLCIHTYSKLISCLGIVRVLMRLREELCSRGIGIFLYSGWYKVRMSKEKKKVKNEGPFYNKSEIPAVFFTVFQLQFWSNDTLFSIKLLYIVSTSKRIKISQIVFHFVFYSKKILMTTRLICTYNHLSVWVSLKLFRYAPFRDTGLSLHIFYFPEYYTKT